MKVVRKRVFETNSSSCHSISISENDTLNNIPTPDENGDINIYPQDFGWEQDHHYDFDTKASYLAIYCRDWSNDKEEDHFRTLEECIKEVTQCKSVVYIEDMMNYEMKSYEHNGKTVTYKSYGWESGGIDHGSVDGEELHHIFEDKELVKAFLFSSNSVLETDNDNH